MTDLAIEKKEGLFAEAVVLMERVPETVQSRAGYELAGSVLRDVKDLYARLDTDRRKRTKPLDDEKKRIIEEYRPALEALKQAEDGIKNLMVAYQQVEDERVEEERALLEAAASRAVEEGRYEDAEAIQQERDSAETEYRRRDERGFKPAYGVTTSERWHAEVYDLERLVMAVARGNANKDLVMPNQKALDALARSHKDALSPPPGVRFVSKRSIAAAGR